MSFNNFPESIVITNIPTPNSSSYEFEWECLRVYNKNEYPDLEGVVIKSNYTPVLKDRLYFFKGCDVPRFKVRPWAANHGASVTIRADLASTFIVSDNVLSNLLSRVNSVKIPTKVFIKWLEDNYSLDKNNYRELYDKVLNSTNEYVYFNEEYASYRGRHITGFNYRRNTEDISGDGFVTALCEQFGVDCNHFMIAPDEKTVEQLEYLYSGADIYSQTTIIKQINSESATLNEDMYQELRNMFLAKDRSNYPMALEIMGSCNLDASLFNLLRLLKEFGGSVIYNMKESSHVNFVSLLKVLGLTNHYTSLNNDSMIDCLIKHDQLTGDVVKSLAADIKEQWKKNVDEKYFKIHKVTVSDVVKEILLKEHESKQLIVKEK